jgi:hypothetical protein
LLPLPVWPSCGSRLVADWPGSRCSPGPLEVADSADSEAGDSEPARPPGCLALRWSSAAFVSVSAGSRERCGSDASPFRSMRRSRSSPFDREPWPAESSPGLRVAVLAGRSLDVPCWALLDLRGPLDCCSPEFALGCGGCFESGLVEGCDREPVRSGRWAGPVLSSPGWDFLLGSSDGLCGSPSGELPASGSDGSDGFARLRFASRGSAGAAERDPGSPWEFFRCEAGSFLRFAPASPAGSDDGSVSGSRGVGSPASGSVASAFAGEVVVGD